MTAPGIIDVLSHRQFRALVVGVTASRVGDAMTLVVVTWLALNIGGPRAVGLVVFASGSAVVFSAPAIGYLMDRLGLRLLMFVDNVVRGLLMVGLAVIVHTGHARVIHLVMFAVAMALLSPATELGQNVAIPELLNDRELDAANRLLSASWDIAAWVGPAIAGFGITLLGSPTVLLIDAATFAVMAVVARAMPGRRQLDQNEDGQTGTGLSGLLSGFTILWRLRPVALLTVVSVISLFFSGMFEVFLPAFNQLTLHEDAAAYGLLVSISGAASLLGTLALTPALTRLGYRSALVLLLAARGLAMLPLAFVGSWGLAAVFVALAAAPDGSFFPIARTVQQRLIPAAVRGRVQGAKTALGVIGFPLGAAVGGLLMATTSAQTVALVMGLGCLPLAALVAMIPELKRTNSPNVQHPMVEKKPAAAAENRAE